MAYITPLRYPGGKGKLANYIKLILQTNNLMGGHYAEPYAGGAGVAFDLLFEDYVSQIHINDLNKSVYAFWLAVLEDTDNLCRLIQDTIVNMDNWYIQKNIQEHSQDFSKLELGFSTFFLNRTNRSGILTGGVIGGKEQSGEWLLDARYNKQGLIDRIRRIADQKKYITVYNLDASEFIVKTLPDLPANSLIYLDPPYYIKGYRLYENHYQHDDHAAIANLVTAQIKQNWIVSYDNAPEICKLYDDYAKLLYQLNYSAHSRYQGSEVMFFSPSLKIPQITNPAKVKAPHRNLVLC